MIHNTNNEAGCALTHSGLALVTTQTSNATLNKYSQANRNSKRNSLAFVTPNGRIVISARQERRALAALIAAGSKGVTALEQASWALRLAAYVHTLRTVYGLVIETVREPHDEGWHGRYILHTPCRIAESQMEGGAL